MPTIFNSINPNFHNSSACQVTLTLSIPRIPMSLPRIPMSIPRIPMSIPRKSLTKCVYQEDQ